MTSRQLRTIQELIESGDRRDEKQYAEIKSAAEQAKVDLGRSARQEQEHFEEMKAETADLGWALEEVGEAARQGVLRLDHHLDRVQAELSPKLDRIERHLEEGPRAKAAREYRERGERASANGLVDDALADFHRAETENYEDFEVHFQLADLYAELGDDAKAIEYFEKTAKYARPYSRDIAAEALVAAAGLQEQQGDLEGAYKHASEARQVNPQERKIARRVAYVCARLAVRTSRTSEALSALRRIFEIAPWMSLWVPAKPVFAPIRSRIHELLNELKAETEARVRSLLERVGTLRTEIAALLGEKGKHLTPEIDAAVNQAVELLGGPQYGDAIDAERSARRTLRDAWTALAQACDLRLDERRAEEAKLSAKVEGAECQAIRTYVGRGVLVYLLSTPVYLGFWAVISVAIDSAVQQPRMLAHAFPIVAALSGGSAILTGWLMTRWSRRRARDRFLPVARRAREELESLRNEIAKLTAKKERALKQGGVEQGPTKPPPPSTEHRKSTE